MDIVATAPEPDFNWHRCSAGMKTELLTLAREQVEQLASAQRAVKASKPARVQQRTLLEMGAAASRLWFDTVRPALDKVQFKPDTVGRFSDRFQALLLMSSKHPSKGSYLVRVTSSGITFSTT